MKAVGVCCDKAYLRLGILYFELRLTPVLVQCVSVKGDVRKDSLHGKTFLRCEENSAECE